MSKNKEIASRVLESVGGKENVSSVVHCATRLRFKLKNEEIAQTQRLNEDPDVIQVVRSAGQYQVVIGSHVSDVYKELQSISGLDGSSSEPVENKGNVFNRLIDVISSIFTPFLGAMAGAGVLKGFLTLALTMGWMSDKSGVYIVLFAVADGFFTFLPIALAFTAAKKFDTSPFLAVALAMALVHPSIAAVAGAGKGLVFAGIPVVLGPTGYTSSVIPIILAVYVQSYVERFFKKVVPDFLQIIMVPLLIFLVMAPLTFVVLGPIGTIAGEYLGKGYNGVYQLSPMIAGAIMGGLWQVFVMFGMHWGFVPIMLMNLAQGTDTMAPMLVPPVLAQGGAALAVFFLTKNVKLKGLAMSSTITAIFGITEPTVYGVTLPLKKPFISACIGGAVGGAMIGFSHVTNYTFGLASILSFPGFIPQDTKDISGAIAAMIATAVAFVVAFVLTFVFKFEEKKPEGVVSGEPTREDESFTKTETGSILLKSPLTGFVKKISEVPDQVFASGALGKGVAIEPTVGELYAPATGSITTIFPTGHAVGLTTDDGIEILMHIGMDTVELDGKGFTALVKQGDKVKQGELLVRFDIDLIKEAGYSVITPVVVTNTADFLDVLDMDQQEVLNGEECLTVVK